MKPFLFLAGIFLVLVALEFSFIASLPGWIAMTPVIVAVSLSLSVHFGKRETLWFMVAQGFFLDVLHLGILPLETVSYAIAASAAYLCARFVFSGRSFYGLIACGIATSLAFLSSQGALLLLISLRDAAPQTWPAFFSSALIRSLMLFCLLTVLFFRSSPIKRLASFYERL